LEGTTRRKDSARLQWDSKPRRAINPRDIEFQTAEIVIPNPARDQSTITSFVKLIDKIQIDKSKMNRLIWGDNLLAMQALLGSGYEGKIALIYIDPPFWTGENYYATFEIEKTEITKAPSVIERLAYKDIWEGGIDSYLDMMYPRLQLMKRLLSDTGVIFLHTDWHMGHYVKIISDEVFGSENFRSEIIWQRFLFHADAKRFGMVHDILYQYSKTDMYTYHPQFGKWKQEYIDSHFKKDENGRYFGLEAAVGAGQGPPRRFGDKILAPRRGSHWRWSQETIDKLMQEGRIIFTDSGKPRLKYYLDSKQGPVVHSIWTDIPSVNSMASERTGFPTQKPVALLERIIKSSSNEGDIVADFFCGSGTSLVAAEKTNRRWIGCDFSKTALQVARNRLVQNDAKPFLIENIGNYQRQLIYLAGSRISEIQTVVLKLYGATTRKDYPDIGTKKVEEKMELVYVSYPDRPVSAKKAEELESLAEHLDGKGYSRLVILGWDYEYNYDEILRERQRASKRKWNTEIVSKSIPPEVYEYLKKAKGGDNLEALDGKIQFHNKPYLKILKPTLKKASGKNWDVTIGINRYIVFDFPVEKEEQKKEIQEIVRDKPLSLIDYWAVDWDYDGITFKSGWQATHRMGNKIVTVPKTTSKELEAKRLYIVAVRVVDVFGNDAASTVNIDLRGMS
jgi:adenine-specific DNA-methyltransferase